MACESKLREQQWLRTGCNAFDAKRPVSTPLAVWHESDVWQYLREYDVPYSAIYDLGYERTGCVFCAFGAHLDISPNRFQRLQRTHPKLWRYCMKDWDAGGLGLRQVLEYIGVPYENYPTL
jgi:3'-phosphoadenosine 5'-phosphosulfate sulfotransferase (PAPS reductase)/FAD synthetase